MVCRCSSISEHSSRLSAGDTTDYTHFEDRYKKTIAELEKEIANLTPDASKYEIVDVIPIRDVLILKVKYPSCTNCSFEGDKILVYKAVNMIDVLKWRKIDPHFRDLKTKLINEAPSPIARFPATEAGMNHAKIFANTL